MLSYTVAVTFGGSAWNVSVGFDFCGGPLWVEICDPWTPWGPTVRAHSKRPQRETTAPTAGDHIGREALGGGAVASVTPRFDPWRVHNNSTFGFPWGDPVGGSTGGGAAQALGNPGLWGDPWVDPQGISWWIPWGIPTRESLTGYPGGCWGAVPSHPCRECGADVEIATLSCRHLPRI